MPRETITQPAAAGAESALTDAQLAEIREWLDARLAEPGFAPVGVDMAWSLLAEVERLQGGLERAHEELRQGWPKMTYEANRAAIEAMNERDEARAEVERLGQALARVHALHAREDIPAFVYRITDEDGTRDEPHEPFSRCVHCGGSTYPCKTIETNPYL